MKKLFTSIVIAISVVSIGCKQEPTVFDEQVQSYLTDAQRLVTYCIDQEGKEKYYEQVDRLTETKAGLRPLTDADRQLLGPLDELHGQLGSLAVQQYGIDVSREEEPNFEERFKGLVKRIKICQQQIEQLASATR